MKMVSEGRLFSIVPCFMISYDLPFKKKKKKKDCCILTLTRVGEIILCIFVEKKIFGLKR